MATNKVTSGDYNIKTADGNTGNVSIDTHTVTIDGNLVVTGTQTTVSSTDTAITDNIIVLNSGESGSIVSNTTSGIEIDRGTSDNGTLLFNETFTSFEFKIGTSYSKVKGAPPVDNEDFATKQYVDLIASGGGVTVDKIVEGDSKAEIFDDGVGTSRFFIETDASEILSVDATNFNYANVQISGNTISNTANSQNLILDTDAGEVQIEDATKLTEQGSDPTSEVGYTKVYAKAPAGGGSGVYVANINTTDELVTKSKAIVFGLIF